MRNYIVQVNLIEKKKEIFVCSIILNVYALFNVSRVVDYHYYIDFEIERLVNDNLIIFINFIKFTRFVIVFDFNEKSIVTQQNDLWIKNSIHDKFRIMMIFDVFYIFKLSFTFLFVKTFDWKSFRNIFDEKNCKIVHKKFDQLIVMKVNLIDINFYRLILANDIFIKTHVNVYHVTIESKNIFVDKVININVAHRRMSHFNENHFRHLISIFKSFKLKNFFHFCEKYVLTKQIKRNHTQQIRRYKKRKNQIHMNVNESHEISIKEKRYFLLLMNEVTRVRWMYFLK